MKENYFKRLNLDQNCSSQDVKDAFHKLAKIHHPDISKAKNSHDEFKRIHEAYTYLQNDGQRAVHRTQLQNDYRQYSNSNTVIDQAIYKHRAQQDRMKRQEVWTLCLSHFMYLIPLYNIFIGCRRENGPC
jgi:DnaJ-class molecular chaperone